MIDGMHHDLQIIPIPALKDNYIWLIHNGYQAIIVDPGDAVPVLAALHSLNLTLHTILVTHHHHDHIDGVTALLKAYPNTKVYAPSLEQYTFEHIPVSELNVIALNEFNLTFAVIDLPGHTLGHIAYYSKSSNGDKLLFCGDTLFGAGCGRLFEGSPAQMYDSLQKLAALPVETKVYCTHEYTLQNIQFALTLEPSNQALALRFEETKKLTNLKRPTLPSSIALELASNPFLRCRSHEIQSTIHLKNAGGLEVFSTIRQLRNNY